MTDETQETQAYTYDKPLPARHKILESGAVYDLDAKKIVAGPPGGGKWAITPKTSAEYKTKNMIMREQARIASRKGLAEIAPNKRSLDTWQAIAANHAAQARDGKGRDSVQSARLVGAMTGYLSPETSENEPINQAAGSIAAGFVMELYRLWQDKVGK